jgi:hypothetical protein
MIVQENSTTSLVFEFGLDCDFWHLIEPVLVLVQGRVYQS